MDFFASMGGFFIRFDDGTSYTLDLKQLAWCFENGHLSCHDISISEREIEDRSKSSMLAKAVTCGQSIWLVLQCIVRTGQHLPISRLELATCAYAACSLTTWYFWLKKPFDVDQQTVGGPVLKKEVLQQMLTALPDSEHPTGRVRTQGALWPSKVASFGMELDFYSAPYSVSRGTRTFLLRKKGSFRGYLQHQAQDLRLCFSLFLCLTTEADILR